MKTAGILNIWVGTRLHLCETVVDTQCDTLSVLVMSLALILQFVGLFCYFFAFLSAVYYFPVYRRLTYSKLPLSAKALRIHALTSEWRAYFCCAAVFSCSLLVFHGFVYFLLTEQSFEDAFTSLFLGSLTALSPLLPGVYSFLLANETFAVQLLSDFTVFEGVVVNAEESERIRRQLEEDQLMERVKKREKDSRERLELLELELD
ncbi:hypothetical protein AAVH_13915 [Aphelenchoides avenae]|nr:hypothetical protein AAVH_13915 [Aphelenchus avenae]